MDIHCLGAAAFAEPLLKHKFGVSGCTEGGFLHVTISHSVGSGYSVPPIQPGLEL